MLQFAFSVERTLIPLVFGTGPNKPPEQNLTSHMIVFELQCQK